MNVDNVFKMKEGGAYTYKKKKNSQNKYIKRGHKSVFGVSS